MYEKERIYYLDILKSIAIFSVIFIHVFALGYSSQVKGITVSDFSEIFKFAVPIFLMITGTLLLNRNYDSISLFLKNKLSRIIFPYLFWMIFIILSLVIPNGILAYPNAVEYIIFSFFNFPLAWYFWLMIGVYFLIPVLNEFIKKDDLNASKYIVVMFIVSSILYQVLSLFKTYTFIDLTFFILPVGYLCLGYFLANYDFNNKKLIFTVSFVIFIISSIIELLFNQSFNLTLCFSNLSSGYASSMDLSIIRILQASSLFLFIKYLPFEKFKMKKIIQSISKSTYGIYLVHIFVYLLVFHYVPVIGSGKTVFLTLLSGSVFVFLVSWVIVLIASKIPFISKFSGYA